MRRFEKDKKYVRNDYKLNKQPEQLCTFNNLQLKVRVSTPSTSHKFHIRSMPRHVQTLLSKSLVEKNEDSNVNIHFRQAVSRMKDCSLQENHSFYKQFLQLEKESKNYISYYDRKYNQKFIELLLKSAKEQCIILIILRDKFPQLDKENLSSRKLLALGINPDDDFDAISWSKYSLLRKLMTQKSIDISVSVKYLVKFFLPNNEPSIKKDDFITLVSSILRQFDNKLINSSRDTLLGSVLKRADRQVLLRGQEIKAKGLRELLGKQSLFSCSDFLYLLFHK